MTTYAPTYTPRWKGTYVAMGIQHTLTLRAARGSSYATMDGYKDRAREVFAGFADVLGDDFSWVKAEVALTDSDVFVPGTTPTVAVPGTFDFSAISAIAKIKGLTFAGKAADGRARFTLFGLWFLDDSPGDEGANGIITPGEHSGVAGAVSTANTYFHAASGSAAGWYSRATYKANDHLLKLVRRGIIG
jgi:hypothetical protein